MAIDRSVQLEVLAGIEKYAQGMRKIPGITDKQAARAAVNWQKHQDKMALASARAAKKSAAKWGESFKGLGSIIGPALVASTVTSFVELANAASEYTDKLVHVSSATGIAIEQMVGLDFALRAGGSSLEDSQGSLVGFSQKLGDAALNGGSAADQFERLGVAVKDQDGKMRDAEDVLKDTLKALGGLESGTERATVSVSLLGEKGGELTAALGDGIVAWEHYTEQTRQAGLVMDETGRVASAQMDVAVADLTLTLQGMTHQVGNALIPTIQNFTLGLVVLRNLVSTGFDMEATVKLTHKYWLGRKAVVAAATATEGLEEATGELAVTSTKAASAAAAQRRAHDALTKALDAQLAASEQLSDVIDESASDLLSAEQEIHDAYWERLQLIGELEAASGDQASADIARFEAEARHIRELDELKAAAADDDLARLENIREARVDASAEAMALAQEQAAAERAEWESFSAAVNSSAQSLTTELGNLAAFEQARRLDLMDELVTTLEEGEESLTDSQKKALDTRIEAQKEAALAAFNAEKIAAVSSIVASTAVAVMQAAGSAPPPYNLIPMALMAAAGGVQAGIVLAEQPSFDIGGLVGTDGLAGSSRASTGLAPDQTLIQARAGERVVTEAEQRSLQAPIVVNAAPRFEHRHYAAFTASHDRLTPGTRPVGHKQR